GDHLEARDRGAHRCARARLGGARGGAVTDERIEVALVTGGSRGIGRAVAVALARRGVAVAINHLKDEPAARDAASAVEAAGGRALVVRADVARADDVEAMFARVERELGAPATLVCAAGIARDTLLGASEPADWDAVIATNLMGTVHCCRAA